MAAITLPERFAEWCVQVDGESGREWVQSLPALVDRLLDRWHLTADDAEPLHGGQGILVLVHRGQERLALKLNRWADATEAIALRAWRGRGAVELMDDDPDTGAMLLERLDSTRSLHTMPLWDAAEVAGWLIRTLAVAAPDGLRSLSDIATGIADGLPARQRTLGDPVPSAWLAAAREYARELGSTGERVLIHADLHYGNVLAGTRQPWLAVDPRPLVGTPEYSVPELMWTRADELHADADVRRLLDVLAGAGGLDASIAHGWVVVRCVDYWLWGLEQGLTIDPARCERILRALNPSR
jgi:streptomycin 6-kinase